jgi:hypothetical protein
MGRQKLNNFYPIQSGVNPMQCHFCLHSNDEIDIWIAKYDIAMTSRAPAWQMNWVLLAVHLKNLKMTRTFMSIFSNRGSSEGCEKKVKKVANVGIKKV